MFFSFLIFSSSLSPLAAEDSVSRRMSIAERDRPLIEALIAEENTLSPKKRHICNGRFLTMHKRRRKKLQTRSLAFEPAVLDDILHGQVSCILRQVGNWRFNAFSLETVTGGECGFRPSVMCVVLTIFSPRRSIAAGPMCSPVSCVRPSGPFQSRCS